MISRKYIAVILAFCNHCILICFYLLLLFFRSISDDYSGKSYDHWATTKPKMLGSVGKNSVTSTWKPSASVYEITLYCAYVFLNNTRRVQGVKRWLQIREAFNKQDRSQCRAGKAGGMRWELVDCSNNRKSTWHEEDYYRRTPRQKWCQIYRVMIRNSATHRFVRTSLSIF